MAIYFPQLGRDVLSFKKAGFYTNTKIWHGTPKFRHRTDVFRARLGKFSCVNRTNRIRARNYRGDKDISGGVFGF